MVNKAVNFPNIDIILSGNTEKNKLLYKIGNILGFRSLECIKAFMAATSVSIENGVMNATMEEYELKIKVVSKTKEKYLLI